MEPCPRPSAVPGQPQRLITTAVIQLPKIVTIFDVLKRGSLEGTVGFQLHQMKLRSRIPSKNGKRTRFGAPEHS
jgi:hypothetical protein